MPAAQGSYGWSPQVNGIAASVTNRYVIKITSATAPTVASTSREPFAIPSSGSDYYVNDASTTNDQVYSGFADAIGNNRNTGTTPGDPKADLIALLESYDIGPGDTVHINTGDYVQVRNIILSNNPATGAGDGAARRSPGRRRPFPIPTIRARRSPFLIQPRSPCSTVPIRIRARPSSSSTTPAR